MNERYRGHATAISAIAAFLDSMRDRPLVLPNGVGRGFLLTTLLRRESARWIQVDPLLFDDICSRAHRRLFDISNDFSLLPAHRFLVGVLRKGDEDAGGFHSRYSHGFRYFSNYGLGLILSSPSIGMTIKTLELARTYLHDSIHASTFRSFRLMPEQTDSAFPVFREQYGMSFRRPSGLSYSAPGLTDRAPHAINLNLLMDGVTVLSVRDAMAPALAPASASFSAAEHEILADLKAVPWDHLPAGSAQDFHRAVTGPTSRFLAHWGGTHLQENILRAMLSGRFRSLATYFNTASGSSGSWKRLFLSRSWKPESRPAIGSRPSVRV